MKKLYVEESYGCLIRDGQIARFVQQLACTRSQFEQKISFIKNELDNVPYIVRKLCKSSFQQTKSFTKMLFVE